MVNTREIAEEYRLSHWARIMQERKESGLSIKDFCQQIGIGANTYFYWQRKLREAACKILPDKTPEMLPVLNDKNNSAIVPGGWAVCEESGSGSGPENGAIPIEINGFRVTVSATTNPQLLEKVCRVLTSLC